MAAFEPNRSSPRKAANDRIGKSRRSQDRRPRLQVLEPRRVLAITPPVFLEAQATLVITGGGLDDTVVVSESTEEVVVQQYVLDERLTTTYPKGLVTALQFFGNDGNDRLTNRTDIATYAEGGVGDDTLVGGSGADTLIGGAGDDRLEGHDGDDTLRGEDGDDALLAGSGADSLDGGADKDLLYGGADDDRLYGGAGNDQLNGEGGEDYLNGGADDDHLYGGADDDFLNGSTGNDRLFGHNGDDTLRGEDGDDVLFGDAGQDNLNGGADDDLLYGGEDNDWLYGSAGIDQLYGEDGEDYLNGGADDDRLYGGADDDFLNGSTGNDRLVGHNGNDTLRGEDGDDVLHGEAGEDQLNGGADDDLLYGGEDNDWLYGSAGIDQLYGDNGEDYLNGGTDDDRLYGGADDDFLNGSTGNDRLVGHNGNDTLRGEDGDDVLHGEAGEDHLNGGADDDLLYGGEDKDRLYGASGNDQLYGDSGEDDLNGGADNDRLYGGSDNDSLFGGDGDDRLEGESGADVLLGNNGIDILIGGSGRDLAIGGGGSDTVSGSEEEDILIGASTAYDTNTEALREVLAAWDTELGYEERVELLSSSEGSWRLVPHETVFADLAADTLLGGGGTDWFVLSAINGVYNPLGMSDHHGMTDSHHSHAILLDTPPEIEGFALIDSIDHLEDLNASEAVHTLLAHADDASKLGEHFRVLQLVRYADVTHTAVQSGEWADPNTWEEGRIPTADARVLIPFGASVTVAAQQQTELFTVRVDGTLLFSTDQDSELKVDTLIVTETGSLQMGTAEQPVQEGVTAKLLITDNGPMDREADPFGLGRGLITHGQVRLFGAEVTSFVAASGDLLAGDTTVRLASSPTGWSVGDEIVIAGTAVGGGQDETRVILAIDGNEVTVDALAFDHAAVESGLEVHVANLTRNVIIESAATIDSQRGHVMFMHNRDIHVSNTAFNGLGRTDKSIVLTDPEVDEDWNLIGDTGNNPRARYSVHFHRNGVSADSPPATVHSSVVNGSPGWGFVNHSSYVDFTSNVSYGVNGAAFVAEAGDEIGLFDGNLALHTTGTSADVDSRVGQQDFGFNGDGFWLQSPGVTVVNNIASGSTGSAFIYYTRGLRFGSDEISFLAENLDDPTIAAGNDTLPVISTPIKKFEGNVGYASQTGLTIRYNLRGATHSGLSVVSDSTFWNNEIGVDLPYANHAVLRDLVVLVDPSSNELNGVSNNAQTRSITYENLRVEGYQRGLLIPLQGENVVEGGHFVSKNANILIRPADAPGLEVLVTGTPWFGSVDGFSANEVAMKYQTDNAANNPNHVFHSMEVYLRYGRLVNYRLYFHEQHADAIPFPEAISGISQDYVGLTQAELSDQFGLAVGGEIAPDHSETIAGIFGIAVPARASLPRQSQI